MNNEFIIEEHVLKHYEGTSKIVKIPDNVFEIGENAFYGNKNIEQVILPLNTKIINDNAFYQCVNLKEINLEEITNIKYQSFYECLNLKNVNFNKIKSIGVMAFNNCGLEEIVLPKTLINLKMFCFKDCNQLKSIELNSNINDTIGLAISNSDTIKKITINNTDEKINIFSHNNFKNIEKIIINNPNYVTKSDIIYSADETELVWCPPYINTKEFKIPDNVIKINEFAFAHNKKIKKIIFNNKIQEINKYAFYNCNIDNIIFKNLKYLPNLLFTEGKFNTIDLSKTNLKVIDFRSTYLFYEESVFTGNFKSVAEKIILPNKLEKIYIPENSNLYEHIYISQPKEKFSNNIQKFIEYFNIKTYSKTLDELLEEGKNFREASQIMKNYER